MDKETFLEILPEYQKEAPVNLVQIANRLELGIYSSSMLNPAISGKLIRIKTEESKKFDKGSGWYLLMNRDRPIGAIKECLAYLIAKFVIMDLEGFNLLSDSVRFRTKSTLNDPMEREINKLALEILLPNQLLIEAIEEGKYIHELPALFKVDPSTLTAKLGYSVYPIDFWVNARSSH
ncbi:MAG: ImmA/IrrE family metallo-endopeptidase [Sphaerochaetaceae bacterium]|nr:ImmA/IrrE family metallo-endopeptidase [Sphaerochaetaceae bacterium]